MKSLSAAVMVCVHLAAVSGAVAQATFPLESELRFEVWDGTQWASSVHAAAGDRVEWRAVVSYTGTRTDIQGLSEALYQPVVSNADNAGVAMDALGPWRNGGEGSEVLPGTLVTTDEGESGGPLASYGRVGMAHTGTISAYSNILTTFRHSGGSGGAPAGEWLRVAGSFVTQWPVSGSGSGWNADDANRLLRGVSAAQNSRLAPGYPGGVYPYFREGTQRVVIFRQALVLGDATDRVVEITTMEAMLRRAVMYSGSTDNRRYISWYTQDSQTYNAAYKTSVVITPATIFVPAPVPSAALVVLLFARRRARD
ncbi:MAG: hypothetical protein U0637_13895 [Phycisphaerales bacterium]